MYIHIYQLVPICNYVIYTHIYKLNIYIYVNIDINVYITCVDQLYIYVYTFMYLHIYLIYLYICVCLMTLKEIIIYILWCFGTKTRFDNYYIPTLLINAIF